LSKIDRIVTEDDLRNQIIAKTWSKHQTTIARVYVTFGPVPASTSDDIKDLYSLVHTLCRKEGSSIDQVSSSFFDRLNAATRILLQEVTDLYSLVNRLCSEESSLLDELSSIPFDKFDLAIRILQPRLAETTFPALAAKISIERLKELRSADHADQLLKELLNDPDAIFKTLLTSTASGGFLEKEARNWKTICQIVKSTLAHELSGAIGIRKAAGSSFRGLPDSSFEGVLARSAGTLPDESWLKMIIVPRDSGTSTPTPTQEVREEIFDFVRSQTLITTRLRVSSPHYWSIRLRATVVRSPQSRVDQEAVRQGVVRAVRGFLDPIGGWDGHGWPFGRSVYRSDLCSVIEAVDGVDHVRQLYYRADDDEMIALSELQLPGPDWLIAWEEETTHPQGTLQVDVVDR
jgi:hypothetical protein